MIILSWNGPMLCGEIDTLSWPVSKFRGCRLARRSKEEEISFKLEDTIDGGTALNNELSLEIRGLYVESGRCRHFTSSDWGCLVGPSSRQTVSAGWAGWAAAVVMECLASLRPDPCSPPPPRRPDPVPVRRSSQAATHPSRRSVPQQASSL